MAAAGANRAFMDAKDEPDRRLTALVTALTLNRGEIDPATLERLLRLVDPKPAAASR